MAQSLFPIIVINEQNQLTRRVECCEYSIWYGPLVLEQTHAVLLSQRRLGGDTLRQKPVPQN